MAITNQQAIQELQAVKARSDADSSGYWLGVLLGTCGAYWQAEIITFDQYMQLTNTERATA